MTPTRPPTCAQPSLRTRGRAADGQVTRSLLLLQTCKVDMTCGQGGHDLRVRQVFVRERGRHCCRAAAPSRVRSSLLPCLPPPCLPFGSKPLAGVVAGLAQPDKSQTGSCSTPYTSCLNHLFTPPQIVFLLLGNKPSLSLIGGTLQTFC